jgi:predicted NBD/HSP70 family sugar kinase
MLADALKRHPNHPLASSAAPEKEKALSLRDLAQEGDVLALEIFDLQAKALGVHAANLIRSVLPSVLPPRLSHSPRHNLLIPPLVITSSFLPLS